MERKIRYIWWGVLGLLIVAAVWKFILPHNSSSIAVERADQSREIVVYVSGAVEKPGLVHLPVNARLDDALKQVAPLPEANIDQINPAEKLRDGQKVIVPYKPVPQPTVQAVAQPQGQGAGSNDSALPSSVPAVSPQQGATGANTPYALPSSSNLININTADLAELDKLPGIGPALGERIIQYRTEHGLFLQPEDLKKVSGIGNKTYEKMADLITVGP